MTIPEFLSDATMKLNPAYTEILLLHAMLDDAGVPNKIHRLFDGWQIVYLGYGPDEWICDAIQHFGSYGADENMLEIMGLSTEDDNSGSITGYLTAEEVYNRILDDYTKRTSE